MRKFDKIGISIDKQLNAKLAEFCKANGFSKSGLIALALIDYMDAFEKRPIVNKKLQEFEDALKTLQKQMDEQQNKRA